MLKEMLNAFDGQYDRPFDYTDPGNIPPAVTIPDFEFQPMREACWHCSRALMTVEGKGFCFVTIEAYDGFPHKVHRGCYTRVWLDEHAA